MIYVQQQTVLLNWKKRVGFVCQPVESSALSLLDRVDPHSQRGSSSSLKCNNAIFNTNGRNSSDESENEKEAELATWLQTALSLLRQSEDGRTDTRLTNHREGLRNLRIFDKIIYI